MSYPWHSTLGGDLGRNRSVSLEHCFSHKRMGTDIGPLCYLLAQECTGCHQLTLCSNTLKLLHLHLMKICIVIFGWYCNDNALYHKLYPTSISFIFILGGRERGARGQDWSCPPTLPGVESPHTQTSNKLPPSTIRSLTTKYVTKFQTCVFLFLGCVDPISRCNRTLTKDLWPARDPILTLWAN